MRIIPVIDLRGGTVVHAVRGERERYRPLRSRLTDSADPRAVARALRRLGLEDLYVADLDAIAGRGDHHEVVAALAREARVWLDAGTGEPAAALALGRLGVHRVVVGTETLAGAGAWAALRRRPGAVLSLDLRDRRLLAADPRLAGLEASAALDRLADGARDVIVLDLARVGSGGGPDLELVAALHARRPSLRLHVGGGVRHAGDLRALEAAGAAGALVASALHDGAIGPEDL